MHEPFDISTIIFALLAVFVVWKLRSVLGTRAGTERPPFDPFANRRKAREASRNPPGETGTVIRLPGAGDGRAAEPQATPAERESWAEFLGPNSSSVLGGIERIKSADPAFSVAGFMQGAQAAYELIVLAYAKGDRAALAPLLAKEVFDGFSASINEREAAGRTVETTFVSLGKGLIEDAQMRGRVAHVTVRFQPKLITVTRDRDGTAVDGRADQVTEVTDLWTFARDVGSTDPNWKLVATETIP